MTPERWQRVEALFGQCVALAEPAERHALLRRECLDDAELLGIVDAMLEADLGSDEDLRAIISASVEEAAERSAEPWTGRVLGAYRIEREIGAGGMGTVFLARRADAQYERQVAIKVLSNAFASQDERRRFVSERQILANLAHPHIAQLLDGGTTTDGTPYLVMEYIEGVPIDEYCGAAKLSIHDRLRLFLRVCSAVQYAHQNLVIHRDIKPTNILVTSDGTPKLLDFGIAKPLDTAPVARTVAMTRLGARLMTPRHASPEQIRGDAVTTASDVYSLGVLLYYLLTGRYPYDVRGERVSDIEHAILETQPHRPSTVASHARRQLAGDLDNIVLKALRKEPERRYATVNELARDIQSHLTHLPVTARPDSGGYRLRKFVQRHRIGVATSVAVAGIITALVIFYTLRLAEERDLQARERAAADRVSQFMVDVFRVADPQSGRGDITARELLEQAYGAIDDDMNEQPLVTSKLMMAMGRAYAGLALFERSVELQTKALELRRQQLPPDDPEIADALHHLGVTKADRADYAGARADLEAALAIRRQRLGPLALPVGETLSSLAFVEMRESKYPQMRAALDESLAIHLATAGPDDPRTATVYALLGSYHWGLGQNRESQEATARALAIEERAAEPNELRIAAFIHTMGLIAWQSGQHAEAIAHYERELALLEKRLGREHPRVGNALYGLANSSGNVGRYGEALAYFERAAALQEKVFGPQSPALAMTLGGQGFLRLRLEDYAGARRALERSLAMFEARLGPQHSDLRSPLAGLSKVDIAERRYGDARRRMERALGIVEATFPAEHPDVLRTRISLADAYRAQGDHAKALELYEPSIAALERTIGLDHPYAVDALCGAGAAFALTGDSVRALERYRRARANLASRKQLDQRVGVAECLEGYSAAVRQTGALADAADAAATARNIRGTLRAARLGVTAAAP
jgi:serine/threonine protein kinase/tetratricopeptide (TPR) repeat protein